MKTIINKIPQYCEAHQIDQQTFVALMLAAGLRAIATAEAAYLGQPVSKGTMEIASNALEVDSLSDLFELAEAVPA